MKNFNLWEMAREKSKQFEKQKTPNCVNCKWGSRYLLVKKCIAQGESIASNVYGNEFCKKLFEIENEN